MEVHHKPKPWRGAREFLKEILTIVIGVLIALGGEQAVEASRWGEKVKVVRASIMGELANDRARWEADMRGVPCVLSVIDRLDRWAADGAPEATRPDGSTLRDQLSLFYMHSSTWNVATASQALDHFPVKEQLALASLYDALGHRQIELEHLQELSEQAQSLLPLASDEEQRRNLRTTLGSIRSNLGENVGEDAYMRRHFNAIGVKPDRSDFEVDYSGQGCVN